MSSCDPFFLQSKEPTVILNEVKNRIVTKGKPTAEILHFVLNVPMKFNQCFCFACGTNDKPKKHPPAPFKGGIMRVIITCFML